MKKLLAILMTLLLLCTMIPFATVFAADEPTAVLSIVDGLAEINAGDEFQVEVNLNNLDSTDGLIGALIEIGYDHDVFELVTYFDEDEEMWMPQIEVGDKYNASSNKYITFGPINDDGVSKNCLVMYTRGDAKATQVRKEAHYFTATFRVKDNAVSGTYDLNVAQSDFIEFAGGIGGNQLSLAIETTSIKVNGSDPVVPPVDENTDPTVVLSIVDELAEVNAGDEFQVEVNLENLDGTAGLIGALVEIGYDHNVFELVTYFDEDEETWMPQIEVGDKYNASSNKYITVGPIDDNGVSKNCLVMYTRGDAKATQVRKEAHYFTATFKVKADAVSGTYELNVAQSDFIEFAGGIGGNQLSLAIETTSIKVNGSDPVVPPACEHEYFSPCDQYCMICGELTNPDASHNVVHVEAVAPTCTENGNIEHWFCDVCGQAWLDADCTRNTNLKAVILPATGEHVYDDDADADCNECGFIREVVTIILGDVDGSGKVNNRDLGLLQQYINGYDLTGKTFVEEAADMDGSGKINNRDLGKLQQYING